MAMLETWGSCGTLFRMPTLWAQKQCSVQCCRVLLRGHLSLSLGPHASYGPAEVTYSQRVPWTHENYSYWQHPAVMVYGEQYGLGLLLLVQSGLLCPLWAWPCVFPDSLQPRQRLREGQLLGTLPALL